MSEPRKEDKPKSEKSKILLAILIGVILIGGTLTGAYIFVYFVYYSQEESKPTQQNPPNVIPEITNPIESDKFNIANFDRCLKLLIDYVQSFPFPGDKLDSQGQIRQNDILSQYNNLNCPLVEDQLSQTPQYKNRNNVEP